MSPVETEANVIVPTPLELIVKGVLVVEAEIFGDAPEKVKAVLDKVEPDSVPPEMVALLMVLEVAMVEIPDKAPPVVTFSPVEVKANVPVELPMLVEAVPEALILAVPPLIVNPAEPVNNPAEVIVPELVVARLPVVEIEIFEARSVPVTELAKLSLL